MRRQIFAALGTPGKGTLAQSANAQSFEAISVTPKRWPRLFSRAIEISFALLVSRLAGVRPAPGRGRVLPETATKRAKVGPVTPLTTGTWMVSIAAAGLKAMSPCQPLQR